jgi:hypothetical protein
MFWHRKSPHLTLDSLDARLSAVEAAIGVRDGTDPVTGLVIPPEFRGIGDALAGALASYGAAIRDAEAKDERERV